MRATARTALLPMMMMVALSGCAGMGLENMLQPPSFRVDGSQQAHLRLLAPSFERPAGGAAVRLYARVGNPNPVGLTLTRLVGSLRLEGRDAARVDFPLGVPLQAGGEALVPIDIALDFNDLPGLAEVARNALTGRAINYSLDGTVGVDAGLLRQLSFGPMTLLSGELRATR
ncbi:MAG TPA: LEA type 2 family protein [Longimicrobium sp.]|nr:LEA type 2 family protein [Longimicrobium sp.]